MPLFAKVTDLAVVAVPTLSLPKARATGLSETVEVPTLTETGAELLGENVVSPGYSRHRRSECMLLRPCWLHLKSV